MLRARMTTTTTASATVWYSWSCSCYHKHPKCYGLRNSKTVYAVQDRRPVLRLCRFCRDDFRSPHTEPTCNDCSRAIERCTDAMPPDPVKATPTFLARLDEFEQQSSPRTVQTVRWNNSYDTTSNDFLISPSPAQPPPPVSFDSDHVTTTPLRPKNFDYTPENLSSVLAMGEPSSVSTIGLETPSSMIKVSRLKSAKVASVTSVSHNRRRRSSRSRVDPARKQENGVYPRGDSSSSQSQDDEEMGKHSERETGAKISHALHPSSKLAHGQPNSKASHARLPETCMPTTSDAISHSRTRAVRTEKQLPCDHKSTNSEATSHSNLEASISRSHYHTTAPHAATVPEINSSSSPTHAAPLTDEQPVARAPKHSSFVGELEPMEQAAEDEKKTPYDRVFLAKSIPLNTVRRVSELSLLDRPPPQLKKNLRVLPRSAPPPHSNTLLGDDQSGLSFPEALSFGPREREPIAKARRVPEPRKARRSPTTLSREKSRDSRWHESGFTTTPTTGMRPPTLNIRPSSTEAAKLILMSGMTTTEPLTKGDDMSMSFVVDSSDPPMPPRPKSFLRVDTISDASTIRPRSLRLRLFGSCLGYGKSRYDSKAYL